MNDHFPFVILKRRQEVAMLGYLGITIIKDLECAKSSFMEDVKEMKTIFGQLMNAEDIV